MDNRWSIFTAEELLTFLWTFHTNRKKKHLTKEIIIGEVITVLSFWQTHSYILGPALSTENK